MRLRFTTAGESHGKALVAIVEGLPAGLPVSADWVDRDLARRMQGYGRGARMKIERDRVEWISGIRAGETLGSPVAMLIPNRDWGNWEDVMSPDGEGEIRRRRVTRPRPGHADLVGVLKYDRLDARDILERASARETTARVAAGALARRLLDEFSVEIGSHVVSLGGIRAAVPDPLPAPLNDAAGGLPGMPENLRETIASGEGVTYWGNHHKAAAELGFAPRTLAQGVADTWGGTPS